MHKRGQVTVFVILGILIIAVLAIIFYLYGEKIKIPTQDQEFDFSKTEIVKNYIESCIEKAGNEALTLVGKQGGEVNPGFYQQYYNDKISYLCYTNSYSACYNKKPFLKEFIEREINAYIKERLNSCLNLEDIKNQGYEIQTGSLDVNTNLNLYNVLVEINYPITIRGKSGQIVQLNKFNKIFNIPLGRLIKVAEDVVNNEIKSPRGLFFYQAYQLSQNGEIELTRTLWSNTEIYVTNLRNDNYKFQFAIQNYVRAFP